MEWLRVECQFMQLLYKLREKGIIDTNEIREILDNAETEWRTAKEAVKV